MDAKLAFKLIVAMMQWHKEQVSEHKANRANI